MNNQDSGTVRSLVRRRIQKYSPERNLIKLGSRTTKESVDIVIQTKKYTCFLCYSKTEFDLLSKEELRKDITETALGNDNTT